MQFFYSYETGPGKFTMKVVDAAGKTIWQSIHPAFIPDALTGDLIPDDTPMDLGFMKNLDDVAGLEKHLKNSMLLNQDDILSKKYEEGGEIEYENIKSESYTLTIEEIDKYPELIKHFLAIPYKKLGKEVKGGCSTNFLIANRTYSCSYYIFISYQTDTDHIVNKFKKAKGIKDLSLVPEKDKSRLQKEYEKFFKSEYTFYNYHIIVIDDVVAEDKYKDMQKEAINKAQQKWLSLKESMKYEQGGELSEINPDWEASDFEKDGAYYDYDEFEDVIKQLSAPIYKTFNWANEQGDPDIFYLGYDFGEAKSELTQSNRVPEFAERDQVVIIDKYKPVFNSSKLEKLKKLHESLSKDEFEEMFPYKKDIAKFVDWEMGDSDAIETFDIPAINETTDELLYDVQKHFGSKYNSIRLPNGKTLNLRIADHSGNRGNNTGDRNLSVVIANLNPTERFQKDLGKAHNNEIYFDDEYSAEEIIEAVNEAIDDIRQDEEPRTWQDAYYIYKAGNSYYVEDYSIQDDEGKEFDTKEQAEEYAKKEFDKKYGSSFSNGGKIDEVKKGNSIKTGSPVTINYLKNPEKAPNFGKRFGQDVEPSGKYITQFEGFVPPGWLRGVVHFKNPLVIEVTDDTLVEWKYELSKKYTNKKRKALTSVLQKAGYDGIITKDKNGNTGEIIIFSNAQDAGMLAKGGKLTSAKKEKLIKAVTKQYEGKKVKPKYQDKYGKRYSKKEAKSVAYAVANTVEKIKAQDKAPLKKKNYGSLLSGF